MDEHRDKHVSANFWRRNETNDVTRKRCFITSEDLLAGSLKVILGYFLAMQSYHIPLENEHWNWDWWSTDECYKLGCQDSMDLSGLLLEDFMATYHNF